ncbi:hypothetical protein Leryth_020137 [Lithospermum erythrorhizon]|nr:hypothetical protein Leryth_020137 [Lithospermum erythrorhizon]
MEILQSIVAVCCAILFISYAWRILNWAWLKPKKLEKLLKEQGFRGNSYKLLIGDLRDMSKDNCRS